MLPQHCSELVYDRNNGKLIAIFVLRLFKMALNQRDGSSLEQRSDIKYLLVEKRKQCKIHRKIFDMYRETWFNKIIFPMDLPQQV